MYRADTFPPIASRQGFLVYLLRMVIHLDEWAEVTLQRFLQIFARGVPLSISNFSINVTLSTFYRIFRSKEFPGEFMFKMQFLLEDNHFLATE